MRIFLLVISIIFTSSTGIACLNFIAESEISKAINLEDGAGSKRCTVDDKCVCFDQITDWSIASYTNGQIIIDPVKKALKDTRLANEKIIEDQRRARILLIKQRLKTLAQQDDLTASEVKEAIQKLVQLNNLKGEL